MFKTLFFSFRKSRLLAQIAAESGNQNFNTSEILSQAFGKTLNKRQQLIEQLLTLLSTDSYICDLLIQHNRSFGDLSKIINKLEIAGAGQIVKGQYVAVSSIAFISRLQVILDHWDGENFFIDNLDSYNSNLKMAYYLLESFM